MPAGWSLERTLTADLDRDRRDDAVLLLARTVGAGVRERMVAVALRKAEDRYELTDSNRQIIPSFGDDEMEDPMADGEIAASANGFEVAFTLLSGMGSYLGASVRYSFQLQPRCVRLIAYRWLEFHRASLQFDELSVDFVAGTFTRRQGVEGSDEPSERRGELQDAHLRCLKDIGDVNTFRAAMER